MTSKSIKIFYRAASHVPIWKVMEEGGFLAKHGLQMTFGSMQDKRSRATAGLLTGELDIVSGNHHTLYARRALHGEPFVHIAQVSTVWNQHWLVAREGINSIADLKGRKVCNDKISGHLGLNVWLYLRQHGLEPGKDVQLIDGDSKSMERVRHVQAGAFDACFVNVIDQMRAKRLGMHVVDLPTFPMIEGVTLTSTTRYVNSHPEEVNALLLALVDAIHFFRTERQGTLEIINRTCRDLLKIQSDEELEALYDDRAEEFAPKPYPTTEAIRNVFQLAVKDVPEIAGFNPLIMWDLHHLRAIDDSGYFDRLYR